MPLKHTILDVNSLIDHRNKTLWEDIVSKYEVDIQPSLNPEYGCYTESSTATLYVPPNDICADSFTHELLHIYIRLKEVYIGSSIKSTIAGSNILSRIFVPALTEHVGNCLDHVKMFPIYTGLGFRKEKFLYDYNIHKCTDYEIKEIKQNYKLDNRYNPAGVELFIGKYFAIKADPNDTFDYKKYLSGLSKIDDKLFATLTVFLNKWLKLDIEKNDPINNYHSLSYQLYQDLKKWMTNKTFL